ncbi:anthranilate phosphoribosyltransferase [Candidatus Desantisbacteria bacterium CG_4_10_14_0_8_um_filter_48_22]|uniref:Anthranilate phosphoribosyltransferase n=1 Tax=Candidatus Desantisbacteria bacterium CG_4_10_14_0_8_um_filter_48_22 TaxID=1974543 RepID=A0A2M7SBB0_9BACT|nr:MAG: anthranilate phosphoribosyltransferase [Candidatus Desantisbacteria bacterium CG1_02_49_89]PIV55459.1 MAG: anthranilate phosphoribosyltransferase [Candidatus Desantisbacteria bacterium CG02_land_8_20_14_3_00_49_13]PIZ16788.1 MAG: anthranilate phosphoribosyltransferase [Candidatus Desantisbacteria bacterium CG_4_10_14_0_8_um_filter_48_22]
MIREAIAKVIQKQDMAEEEAAQAINEIMDGAATPSQISALITALRMKGETVEEITGFAKVMRRKAVPIDIDRDGKILADTCGTGGDGAGTFNISTAVALVAAGAGLAVAKHGNRSVSSSCGSADVFAALGVNIEIPAEKVKECVEKIGIGFLFAPLFHSAMKHAGATRKEIGIRTIFNILGPLTNPANPSVQLVGVYDPMLTEIVIEVLKNLGLRSAMVVHSEDGLDEISISAPTKITHFEENADVETYSVKPEDFGLSRAALKEVAGGSAKKNAEIVTDILAGEKGPKRDIVILNAAGLFVTAGIAKDFFEGIKKAEHSIDSSLALKKLNDLIEFTQGL